MSSLLNGQWAVVTGATSGIGAAITEALVARGVKVAGVVRDAERLDSASRRYGEAFLPVAVDLSVCGKRAEAFARLAAELPRVDLVVNNAAEVVYESPVALDTDRWRRLLEVNLLAGMELVRAAAPKMRPGGQVVNVSSVTARFVAAPKFAPYGLTKSALEDWTEAIRMELAPRGIKVSLVVPGLVDTPIYDKAAGFERTKAKLVEAVPQWLSAKDVADAVLWMLERPAGVVVSELVLLPQGQSR